jgi:Na+/proline symporter
MGLMGVGSIIWFIPPWASAILYPDAASAYPELGNKAGDAIYLVFARNAMPAGTVGLLLAGLFAASMSSMDSALTKNAGIFVRSVYQPFLARRGRQADDRQLLRLSMLVILISGLVVIAMALFFKSLKELSLFDLMMQISAMVQVPLLVPLIVGLFIKKTPDWAPWATVMLGLFVSYLIREVANPQMFADLLGMNELTRREAGDMNLIVTLASHLFITAGFFCLTSLFYREEKDVYESQRESFFVDLETPVVADSIQDSYDQQQRDKLGSMVSIMGAGVLLMAMIPNPIWGRLVFLSCALVILTIGWLLKRSARPEPGAF